MIEIKFFADCSKETLIQIATLHYEQWKPHNDKLDLKQKIKEFTTLFSNKNKIPFGLVAFDKNNNILGFVRIKKHNLDSQPNLYPWISSLLILPTYRKKGVWKSLIFKAAEICHSFGYKSLYVYTDVEPEYYKHIGCKHLGSVKKMMAQMRNFLAWTYK